ncbi:MAG: radical SAM protein, partial [Spirochaetae bacterium HGW-Spirochaetae-6]
EELPAYYTFSGSGEPTLAANIGEIIRFIKEQKPQAKVAVLTNGTLLWQKDVRDQLLLADLVMPSLDAALPETLKRINRPAEDFSVKNWVEGLKAFRKEYQGLYHLEIFIIPELNTSKKELEEFKRLILEIIPDKVQLNTLDRPGVLFDLVKAPKALLEEIMRFWDIPNVEIIGNYKYEETLLEGEGKDFLKNFILGLVKRRPCTISDLVQVSGKKPKEVSLALEVLEKEELIWTEMRERGVFYRGKG